MNERASRICRRHPLSPSQVFHYTSGAKKDSKLLAVLTRHVADPYLSLGSALIFAESAETAERLRVLISGSRPNEPPPLVLHEAMDDAERRGAIGALRNPPSNSPSNSPKLLIATGVAARGLDLPDLRHVVLYDMPTDVAGYIHCAGRTARRGSRGVVSCLVESNVQAGRFRDLHALTAAPPLSFAADGPT